MAIVPCPETTGPQTSGSVTDIADGSGNARSTGIVEVTIPAGANHDQISILASANPGDVRRVSVEIQRMGDLVTYQWLPPAAARQLIAALTAAVDHIDPPPPDAAWEAAIREARALPRCGQCGQPWAAPACGPTHAIVKAAPVEPTRTADAAGGAA